VPKPLKVLIVDDSATARMPTSHMLSIGGHEVAEARDGQYALELVCSERQFDMVLIDMNMPRMSGLEFLEQAREHVNLERMSVFMLTVNADPELLGQVRELGARGFFTKPLTKMHLDRAVQVSRSIVVDD